MLIIKITILLGQLLFAIVTAIFFGMSIALAIYLRTFRVLWSYVKIRFEKKKEVTEDQQWYLTERPTWSE